MSSSTYPLATIMPEKKAPVGVAQTLEAIAQGGDTLDPIKRLRYSVGARAVALSQTVVLGAEGITPDPNASTIYSYVALSSVGLICASIGYRKYRQVERTKVSESESRQNTIRDYLDEPVDIYRARGRSNKGKLSLRWYGTELENNEDISKREVAQRLRKIVEFSYLNGIESIVIGSSWLNDALGDNELLQSKSDVLASQLLKKTKKVEISDLETDPFAYDFTIDECKKLVASIEIESNILLIEELLSKLQQSNPHSRVVEKYEECVKLGIDPKEYGPLREEIKREIVKKFEEPSFSRQRGVSGLTEKIRASSSAVIKGDAVQIFANTRSLDGSEGRVTNGHHKILGSTGAETLEQLYASVLEHDAIGNRKDDAQAFNAAVAVWLLLLSGDTSSTVKEANTHNHMSYLQSQSLQGTLFQRLQREYVAPKQGFNLLPKSMQIDTETAKYHDPRSKLKKLMGATALLLVAATGLGTGLLIHKQSDYIQTEFQIQYDKDHSDEPFNPRSYRQEFKAKLPPYKQMLVGLSDRTANYVNSIENDTADIVRSNTFGFMRNILPQGDVDAYPSNDPNAENTSIDSNLYQPGGYAGIGDVLSTSNKVVFYITPLSSTKSQGYWLTEIMDTLSIYKSKGQNTVQPFNDVTLTYYNIAGDDDTKGGVLPTDKPKDKAIQLFKVSTPYIHLNGVNRDSIGHGDSIFIQVPVYSGSKISSGRIIDQADVEGESNKVLPLEYSFDNKSRTFGLFIPAEALTFEAPLLEYWLETADNALPRARQEMDVFFDKDKEPSISLFLEKILPQIDRAEILKAYGLDPKSTDSDIFEAVRSKTYSYAPYKDSGVFKQEPYGSGDMSAEKIVSSIGLTLANMKYANCNVAATQLLIASQGVIDKKPLNYATGYLEDGDGKLSQLESHAWLVDSEGKIVDATPSGQIAETPVTKPDMTQSPVAELFDIGSKGLLFAVGAMGVSYGFRKRKKIHASYANIRSYPLKKLTDDTSRSAKLTHYSLDILNELKYAPANTANPIPRPIRSTATIADRMLSAPVYSSRSAINIALAQVGVQLDRRTRRHLFRVSNAVRKVRAEPV